MFTRNWDDSLLTGQVLWGTGGQTHSVVSGRCRLGVNANLLCVSQFSNETAVADFDLSIIMNFSTSMTVGMVYRTTSWMNLDGTMAYLVQLNSTTLSLYRGTNSTTNSWTLIKNLALTHTAGTDYLIRIRAVGAYHEVWENGTLKINEYDNTHLGAGQFGLRIGGTAGTYCEYDNLQVNDISAPSFNRGAIVTPTRSNIVINSNTNNRGYVLDRFVLKTTNPLYTPAATTTIENKNPLYTPTYSPKTINTVLTPNKKRKMAVWSRAFNVLNVDTTGSISGTVKVNNVAVPNTLVRIYFKENGFYINEIYTDGNGAFKFDFLEVGKPYYTVIAYVSQYNTLVYEDVKPKITIV